MTVPDPTTIDVSRRQLLASSGSLLVGGGALVWHGSDRARAAVEATQLDLPSVSRDTDDGTVDDVTAQVSGNYQWSAGNAATVRFRLVVAPAVDSDAWEFIDETTSSVSSQAGQGQYTLAGSLLQHSELAAADFSADPEETVERTLAVQVQFAVLDGAGEPVVEALAVAEPTLTVTNTSVKAEAALTGSGQIGIKF
jgi:hypothetical protein